MSVRELTLRDKFMTSSVIWLTSNSTSISISRTVEQQQSNSSIAAPFISL